MKKILIMVAAVVLAAAPVLAKGPQGVKFTAHNFAFGGYFAGKGTYEAGNEDEICIFCHTPHGGSLNGPLWNRNMPVMDGSTGLDTFFTHYTSASLNAIAGFDWSQDQRAVSTESMLCMSCHDGAMSMNSIINYSNRTGALPDNSGNIIIIFGDGIGKSIGDAIDFSLPYRNLSDDHPISFSYYDVSTPVANQTKLHTIADAELDGVRFFPLGGPSAAGGKRVECSSCHDPHVSATATLNPTYFPFLITPNTGSALCLACHKK